MRHGLEAARTKLSKYYSRTYKAQGDIFAIATILDPASKLQYFKGEEWNDDGEVDWHARYRGIFIRVFMHYMDHNPDIRVDIMATDYTDQFETYMQHVTKKRRLTAPKPATSGYREVETYLNEGMFPIWSADIESNLVKLGVSQSDILLFWKNNQARFPILALMARDFLAIPVSGVGVESLFNTCRDICHYRRSRLDPSTIHHLMLLVLTDRFMLKDDYHAPRDDADTMSESNTDSATTDDLVENEDAISEHEDLDEIREDEARFTDMDKSEAILPNETLPRSEQAVSDEPIQSHPSIRQRPGRRPLFEPGQYRKLAGYRVA
jgi:hypothetical protein